MIKNRFIYNKSKERLEVASYSLEKKYYYAFIPNLYYTLFQLMHSILGKPEKKRWEHKGILEYFCYYVYEKEIFDINKIKIIRDIYNNLYRLRELADYKDIKYNDENIGRT